MAARFGFFGTEGGAEAVDSAEGHRSRFGIKLSRLSQIGRLIEVIQREQAVNALSVGSRQNGTVQQHKSSVVEKLAPAPDDLVANVHQRELTTGSQPQVTVIQEKVDAVILLADGIFFGGILNNAKFSHRQLDARRGALVDAHRARHFKTGLKPQALRLGELFVGNFAFHHHGLNEARSVANLQEMNFARTSLVVHPALYADVFACVFFKIFNVYPWRGHFSSTSRA